MSSLEEFYKGLPANVGNPSYILGLEVKEATDKINALSLDPIQNRIDMASRVWEIVLILGDVIIAAGASTPTTDSTFVYRCKALAAIAREDVRSLTDALLNFKMPETKQK